MRVYVAYGYTEDQSANLYGVSLTVEGAKQLCDEAALEEHRQPLRWYTRETPDDQWPKYLYCDDRFVLAAQPVDALGETMFCVAEREVQP